MTTTTPTGRRIARRAFRVVVGLLLAVALVAVVVLAWANTVMAGDRSAALEVWTNDAVEVTETDVSYVLRPVDGTSREGLVFIPGARVDPFAYARNLVGTVEERGTTVVITKPTLNLAFFDTRPLSAFTADAPDVSRWSVGGHSLGGVRACQLAVDGDVEVVGLVLFGSYCANDVSDAGLAVLSVSGTNDGLTTPEDVDANAARVPADATFVVLDGANHADFGDYGPQPGDGTSTLSRADVRSALTAAIGTLLDAAR